MTLVAGSRGRARARARDPVDEKKGDGDLHVVFWTSRVAVAGLGESRSTPRTKGKDEGRREGPRTRRGPRRRASLALADVVEVLVDEVRTSLDRPHGGLGGRGDRGGDLRQARSD